MRVLGLDPSLTSTGYGIIDGGGESYTVICQGTIKPPKKDPLCNRLNLISKNIQEIIRAHNVSEVAIENLFFARNVKTAITLGQVRGAALVAVASENLTLYEYSPLEIKQAVTGYGQADKNQVQAMIRILLNLPDIPLELDASDALATAICHLNSRIFQANLEESDTPIQGKDKP